MTFCIVPVSLALIFGFIWFMLEEVFGVVNWSPDKWPERHRVLKFKNTMWWSSLRGKWSVWRRLLCCGRLQFLTRLRLSISYRKWEKRLPEEQWNVLQRNTRLMRWFAGTQFEVDALDYVVLIMRLMLATKLILKPLNISQNWCRLGHHAKNTIYRKIQTFRGLGFRV